MSQDIKLSCQGVWKLFGPNGKALLQKHQYNPDDEALHKAGLIGAVRDANIDVYESEIFVIMGLSGSGKSTLVRCLSRLVEPTTGQIIFNGKDLLSVPKAQMIEIRRHKMGMVFQHFALLPYLSVLGNVAFPLEIQGVKRQQREQRAMEMIELVGLSGREHNFPRELSGGQQQRVGIARSLAVEPELWFLDEPFSALDPLIRREMQDEFIRLQNSLHKTIIFITHDFDEAIRLADRIAIMKDGRVIQVGAPESLVLSPVDDYVAEFTHHIPRAKVLSVAAVMHELSATDFAGEVKQKQRIEEVALQVEAASLPFAVVNDRGERVGQIDREIIITVLVGRDA